MKPTTLYVQSGDRRTPDVMAESRRRLGIVGMVLWTGLGIGTLDGCMAEGAASTKSDPVDRPGQAVPETDADGLFADFVADKLDGAGHPLGALVFEAEDACAPETGVAGGEGWSMVAGGSAPGRICAVATPQLGRGVFVVNLRALLEAEVDLDPPLVGVGPSADGVDPDLSDEVVFEVVIAAHGGEELARRTVSVDAFDGELVFANLWVEVALSRSMAIDVEVIWPGRVSARLDYLEIFRTQRRLAISPSSGIPDPSSLFRIEDRDRDDDSVLQLDCNGEPLNDRLSLWVEEGRAKIEETEFRRVVTVDSAEFFADCEPPRRITAMLRRPSGSIVEAREVFYWDEPIPCTFAGDRPRVLLTAFVPFPPDVRRVNSSQVALDAFQEDAFDAASLMNLLLPVEYGAAPDLVSDTIRRCRPDAVISFGQGRSRVDLETTGYNEKDTGSALADGIPDNRGIVFTGEEIAIGGAREERATLPLEAIRGELEAAGVDVRLSDDPGRYICNSVLYADVRASRQDAVGGRDALAGFIHLPRMYSVSDDDRLMLRTVVRTAVEQTLLVLPTSDP